MNIPHVCVGELCIVHKPCPFLLMSTLPDAFVFGIDLDNFKAS